jgi:hypothetical protein
MPNKVTIYHKEQGAVEMWAVDANNALRSHSAEWSQKPWAKAEEPKEAKDQKDKSGKTDGGKS